MCNLKTCFPTAEELDHLESKHFRKSPKSVLRKIRSFLVSDTSTLLNNPRLFSLEGENVAELENQNT